MSHPHWWDDMAVSLDGCGHGRFSAAWYAAMRDLYRARFPDADARSQRNMELMAEWAERGNA